MKISKNLSSMVILIGTVLFLFGFMSLLGNEFCLSLVKDCSEFKRQNSINFSLAFGFFFIIGGGICAKHN